VAKTGTAITFKLEIHFLHTAPLNPEMSLTLPYFFHSEVLATTASILDT